MIDRYLIGVLDAKARIHVTRQGERKPRLEICVATTSAKLAALLQEQLGGNVTRASPHTVQWRLTHGAAKDLLMQIGKQLVANKEAAAKALVAAMIDQFDEPD